ncbi:hypothetical protein O9993_09540 [Vibrio lentus]|nr:hypothetical protein [Vibrio lentus]
MTGYAPKNFTTSDRMKEELAIAPFAFLGIKKASQRQGYSRRYQLFEVIVSPNPFIS